jgi:hypothetical protein
VIQANNSKTDLVFGLQSAINGFLNFLDLKEWDDEHSLNIFVYSGHGALV